MERIDQSEFYRLAVTLRAAYVEGEQAAEDMLFPVLGARDAMAKLLKGNPVDLGASRGRADALFDVLQGLVVRYFTRTNEEGDPVLSWPEDGAKLSEYETRLIRQAVDNFEMVFSDEMRDAATYRVPQKGIFYTPKLVDSADETFPPEILSSLPQKTRDDWCAAGRCLAFSLLSASGFHVTRAVEGTMEAYYQLFAGKTGTLNSWYDYHKALRDLDDTAPYGKPSPKTLAELDQMRTDYPNPIAHPRVVLTEADARMLYANGESVIIAMAQEIAAAKADGQQKLKLVDKKGAAG